MKSGVCFQKGKTLTQTEEGAAVLLGLLCSCALYPHKLSSLPFTADMSQMSWLLKPGLLDSLHFLSLLPLV